MYPLTPEEETIFRKNVLTTPDALRVLVKRLFDTLDVERERNKVRRLTTTHQDQPSPSGAAQEPSPAISGTSAQLDALVARDERLSAAIHQWINALPHVGDSFRDRWRAELFEIIRQTRSP